MTADAAIARRAFRQLRTSATVWAVVFGGTAVASALAYASAYPTAAARHQAAVVTSRDPALAVLFGPVADIETVGGYMVYKCFVLLTCAGAVWGLLATTRLLRGEEDGGRWQLVLAGRTRARRATAATLIGLAVAVAVVLAGATVLTTLGGRDPDLAFPFARSVLYGCSLAVAPAVFVGVGAVTSQLGRSRRVASELGMAVFAIAIVLRMVADAGGATRWLLWASPFGWVERIRPFTDPDPRPLVVAAAATAALGALALWLAGRRDAGDGVLAGRDSSPVRPFGLRSVQRLTVRREAGVLAAWVLGTAAGAFAFGMVAKVAADALPASSLDILGKLGVAGALEKQYFGVAFLLVATLVALLPAGQVAAAAEEEAQGRDVLVLALPVRRRALLVGRLALAAAAVVVAAAVAGVAAWAGAATQGVAVGFAALLGAGANVVPAALVVLGVGGVALAVRPRAAAPACYAIVIGSLVVDLVASLLTGARWMEKLSLFHYMALAPAHAVDARAVVVTVVAAVALSVAAMILFDRRDVSAR